MAPGPRSIVASAWDMSRHRSIRVSTVTTPRTTRPLQTVAHASSMTTTFASGNAAVSHATSGCGGSADTPPGRSLNTSRYPVNPKPLCRWFAARGFTGICSRMKSDPIWSGAKRREVEVPFPALGLMQWTVDRLKCPRRASAVAGSSSTATVTSLGRPSGHARASGLGHPSTTSPPAPIRSNAPSGVTCPAGPGTTTATPCVRDAAPARDRVTNESSEGVPSHDRLRKSARLPSGISLTAGGFIGRRSASSCQVTDCRRQSGHFLTKRLSDLASDDLLK